VLDIDKQLYTSNIVVIFGQANFSSWCSYLYCSSSLGINLSSDLLAMASSLRIQSVDGDQCQNIDLMATVAYRRKRKLVLV